MTLFGASKALAIDDKWLAAVEASVQGELDRVSQTLTGRVRELAERYATALPELTSQVEALSVRVTAHLKKKGFAS
jgi:type I restriction enzyme M protein